MPSELMYIYKVLGDPIVEFYFSFWTVFSLNKVIKRYNVMKNDGQEKVVDFAILNAGFGHCIICAYDTEDNKIFYRHDGGSNAWERDAHYDFINSYTSEHIQNEKKLDFSHFLNETQFVYSGAQNECFNRLPLIN